MSSTLSTLGREAARLVLVSPCVACGEELRWRDRVGSCCRSCWDSMPRITKPKCALCGVVWETDAEYENYVCLDCRTSPPPVGWVDAWGSYGGALESVLHAFKFQRHDFLNVPLAGLLAETFQKRHEESFDCVIAVPMHPRKQRQRGYNQAELLARAFCRRTKTVFRSDLLHKRIETQPQSTLARAHRTENVRGTFEASGRAAGKSILVIDDICTTGETLFACARALKAKKARLVCALAVARA